MKLAFHAYLQKAIAAAAAVTGKKFGLLVAGSLIATSGIVASALAGSGGVGPLGTAALAGLLDEGRPAAVTTAQVPEAAPEESFSPPAPPEPSLSPEPVSEPLPESTPSVAPEPAPSPEPEAPTPPPPSEPELPEAGPVKHVFLISLASPGYEAAFGPANAQMPYLAETLRPQGDLLSGFTLLSESWLANSFASLAGQKPTPDSEADCPEYESCVFAVETLSYADQLSTNQFTWRAYLEDMADAGGKPASCVHPEPGAEEAPAPGGYSAVLNPFVYFHTLLDLGDCAANDVPLSELEKDLRKAEKTPSFSYVSPNLCNAGVVPGQCPEGAPEGGAAADAWLSTWVPKILESPAFEADGLLIVTFGAVNPVPNPDPAQPPTPPTSLKTGTLLVSPFVTPGSTDAARYDPYTLLATYEDLFGLDRLGQAGARKVKSLAPQLLAENGGD